MEHFLEFDLEDIAKGIKTFKEIAEKYDVPVRRVKVAFWRHGYKIRDRLIIIHNRYNNTSIYTYSVSECARKLNVSRQVIYNALKGKEVPTLKRMNVELEVIDFGKVKKEK